MQLLKSSLFSLVLIFSVINFTEAEQQPVVQVVVPFVEMHSGPSVEQKIFYVAEQGELITIVGRRTGYFKVLSSDGTAGWISESDIANTLDVNGNKVKVSETGLSGFLKTFY